MKEPEMLRSIASDLRAEASRRIEARQTKAASVLVAVAGLGMLRRKLEGTRG